MSLPPFSAPATAAVVAAGLAALGWGARRRRPVPACVASGTGPWTALAGGLAVWELAAYVQQPRADHPTLSSLANAVLDGRPARTGAFVLWLLGAVAVGRR